MYITSIFFSCFFSSRIAPAPRGVPQIEVIFEVDANGILNVTAVDKSTGNQNKIVITNDRNRLSKEQIEKMVLDAQKYAAEDQKNADKINAKNKLESYAFSLRNSLDDVKLAEKFSDSDKETLRNAIEENKKWMESHETSTKEEFEEQQKHLEKIAMPIMSKVYQGANGPNGMPNMDFSNMNFGNMNFGNMNNMDADNMDINNMNSKDKSPSSSSSNGPTVEEVD